MRLACEYDKLLMVIDRVAGPADARGESIPDFLSTAATERLERIGPLPAPPGPEAA
jgi:hypothetical protein